jgi:hypothetical protein
MILSIKAHSRNELRPDDCWGIVGKGLRCRKKRNLYSRLSEKYAFYDTRLRSDFQRRLWSHSMSVLATVCVLFRCCPLSNRSTQMRRLLGTSLVLYRPEPKQRIARTSACRTPESITNRSWPMSWTPQDLIDSAKCIYKGATQNDDPREARRKCSEAPGVD